MEGFTLVLLIGWLLLMATFAGVYWLDRVVKQPKIGGPKSSDK